MGGGGAAEDTAVNAAGDAGAAGDSGAWGGYYAPTAYDSRRDGLPPDAREAEGGDTILGHSMRKYALRGRGVQCREYLATSDLRVIPLLNEDSEETREMFREPYHAHMVWTTLRNPKALVEAFMPVMVFFIVGGVISVLIAFLMAVLDDGIAEAFSVTWLAALILIGGPYLLRKLGRLAIDRGWVKDKHDVIFDRRTGHVELTWKGKRERMPFAELEAGMRHVVGYAGNVRYHLFLYHRVTGRYVQDPRGCEEPWEVEVEWECLQQFMDVSRPLPELPRSEPFRARDPVTAEYDRRVGRPPDYWKNLDMETAERMYDAAREAAKSYPWRLPREQALAMGWRPSGYGDGEAIWGRGAGAGRPRRAGSGGG